MVRSAQQPHIFLLPKSVCGLASAHPQGEEAKEKGSNSMERSRKLFSVLLIVIVAVIHVHAAPPPGSWTLTWFDEFNGASIDSTKWSWGALPWGGQHHNDEYASWITPEDS